MDKFTATSAVLLATAEALTMAAILRSDWIVTQVAGPSQLGLLRTCVILHGGGGASECFAPSDPPWEWMATLVLSVCAAVALFVTFALTLVSAFDPTLARYTQWSGLVALNFFCFAVIVYPLGFSHPEIGGTAYQLPNSFQVGLAYILFIMALWLTAFSELFAARICLPQL